MKKYFIEICVKNDLDSAYVKKELETLVKCENISPLKINDLDYKLGEVVVLEWGGY